MTAPKNPTPRLERIREVLRRLGPSTVRTISRETGICEEDIGNIIRNARKKEFPGPRFRKAGKTREGCERMSFIYELSDEPDATMFPIRSQPSRLKRIKNPGMTREEIVERNRLRELARQIKPFRHWQDAALFGDSA